jgi:hypothetical protein
MVAVTGIISGDRAGWNGEGYVSIKVGGIVDLKRLAVTFDAGKLLLRNSRRVCHHRHI